jgi:hypothetical protein
LRCPTSVKVNTHKFSFDSSDATRDQVDDSAKAALDLYQLEPTRLGSRGGAAIEMIVKEPHGKHVQEIEGWPE